MDYPQSSMYNSYPMNYPTEDYSNKFSNDKKEITNMAEPNKINDSNLKTDIPVNNENNANKGCEFPFKDQAKSAKKTMEDALWKVTTDHPFATLGLITAGVCAVTYKICVAAIASGVRKGNLKTVRDLYRIRR